MFTPSRSRVESLPSKRRRAAPPTSTSVLHLLLPVRHALHRFLTDEDAARLLRLTSSLGMSLIHGYTISSHVFIWPQSKIRTALYVTSGARISRVCLQSAFNQPLVDEATGQSLLPSSVENLTLACDLWMRPFALSPVIRQLEEEKEVSSDDHIKAQRWLRSPVGYSAFNQPLTPSSIPPGVRYLQLNDGYNQPLQRGVIPASVTALDLGETFNHPLDHGMLPASLIDLLLSSHYNHPLLPHVIPPTVEYLTLGLYFDQPLQLDSLPPRLKGLDMGLRFNQPLPPGCLPSSLTHLRLSAGFKRPLDVGSVPEGVRHLEFMGVAGFDQPQLLPVLPSTLRHLNLGRYYSQRLLPGSLPQGLEVLIFPSSYSHPLESGVIPSTLLLLHLGYEYQHDILPGAIPPTVRWLKLPRSQKYREWAKESLPTTTEVQWYKPRGRT